MKKEEEKGMEEKGREEERLWFESDETVGGTINLNFDVPANLCLLFWFACSRNRNRCRLNQNPTIA